MLRLRLTGLAAVAAAVFAATGATAATLDVMGEYTSPNDSTTYDPTIQQATATCSIACMGVDSTATAGQTPDLNTIGGDVAGYTDLFAPIPTNAAANEYALIEAVTGVADASIYKVNSTAGNFSGAFDWVVYVIGNNPRIAFIHNTTGVSQSYDWASLAGAGAGVSHTYRIPAQVPIPGTLPLMASGLALAGFVAMRRKRKAA